MDDLAERAAAIPGQPADALGDRAPGEDDLADLLGDAGPIPTSREDLPRFVRVLCAALERRGGAGTSARLDRLDAADDPHWPADLHDPQDRPRSAGAPQDGGGSAGTEPGPPALEWPVRSGDAPLGFLRVTGLEIVTAPFALAAQVAAMRCADAIIASTATSALVLQTQQLHEAMASRGIIEQAKGILMARLGVDPDGAFDLIRRSSQHDNIKVRRLAQEIVEARDATRGRPARSESGGLAAAGRPGRPAGSDPAAYPGADEPSL